MNKDIIYIRTGKGERALAESGELAPGLDKILGAIDGRSSIDVIRGRLDKISAGLVDVGLEALVEGELIRDVASAEPVSASTPAEEHARKAQELRDKIRDRRKGGDRSRSSPAVDAWYKARREAEAQAAREAEEQARRTGDEQARRRNRHDVRQRNRPGAPPKSRPGVWLKRRPGVRQRTRPGARRRNRQGGPPRKNGARRRSRQCGPPRKNGASRKTRRDRTPKKPLAATPNA
ncbi:MAG: hypothetical protein K8R10_01725 [Rhodocyclales bacterium]|nr:hypothetical protein [Rhodocyclales bacterium]